jgi:DNA-binding NtrC family response regulator
MQLSERCVLLIEDCPESQQIVGDAFRDQGYAVTTISDAEQALASVEQWAAQFNAVIIQEAICGCSGLELLRKARAQRHDLPVVIVSREGDWNGYSRALSDGAIQYLASPVDENELVAGVEEALANQG